MQDNKYIISEKTVFEMLDSSKRVLLIEPPYQRQYYPLAFGKIAAYIKKRKGIVEYVRNAGFGKYDLICITSLFTTDSKIVINAILECQRSLFLRGVPIMVGGIFASLMPKYIYEKTGIRSFSGYSKKLDNVQPDYSLGCDLKSPWNDACICFTTRGCPNKCGYCMVWRMEPGFYVNLNWKRQFENDKEIALISDNNFLSASIEHIDEVTQYVSKRKKVIFNNGVDCRLVNDDNAKMLARLTYTRQGLRTAFDRMMDDGYYQKAMEGFIKAGIKIKGNSYTYVLFNFDDTPQEAYYRARECWKYGSNPYLMRYRPLNKLTRKNSYIGKYWTKNLIRAFSNYGMNFGYNRGDKSFEGWVKGRADVEQKNKYKLKLTDEDWEKWNYKR